MTAPSSNMRFLRFWWTNLGKLNIILYLHFFPAYLLHIQSWNWSYFQHSLPEYDNAWLVIASWAHPCFYTEFLTTWRESLFQQFSSASKTFFCKKDFKRYSFHDGSLIYLFIFLDIGHSLNFLILCIRVPDDILSI